MSADLVNEAREPSEALVYAERVSTRGGDLEAPLGLCYLALEVPADLAIDLRGLAAGELADLTRTLREDLDLAVGLSAELRRRRIRERNRAA